MLFVWLGFRFILPLCRICCILYVEVIFARLAVEGLLLFPFDCSAYHFLFPSNCVLFFAMYCNVAESEICSTGNRAGV